MRLRSLRGGREIIFFFYKGADLRVLPEFENFNVRILLCISQVFGWEFCNFPAEILVTENYTQLLMELPQPRPFGAEGRKSTHDFLSLYSPVQQDPRSPQGGYLKTHDFLQPLERVGKNIAKDENRAEPAAVEKPRPPAPPPSSVEHILPGGIGTYSISHISYINQRVPKPEGVYAVAAAAQASSSDRNDDNSNCSSYTGSGFTLWEESVVMKKGQTRKENNIAAERHVVREAGPNVGGQWATSLERPSQSSSSHSHLHKTFSSLSSSQPSLSQKNQSFMDMLKSSNKSGQEDEDDDDDEFVIKKEPSSLHKGNLSVKVNGKGTDQKPNTPRSKHSATEQRRRSKINDRFQMLRELIPHSDQKRDKASFLLEVIEYIQFLQEKVHKYEEPYQGWNHEPPKLIPLKSSHRTSDGFIDQSRGTNCGPALMFATKFDETNVSVSPSLPRSGQNQVESEISTADAFKETDNHRGLPLQQTMFSPGGSSSAAVPLPPRLTPDTENRTSQPQSQLWQSRSCTADSTVASDKLKDQELAIESGTISVSSVYSQGLLNTLTQALQSSGVDLSHASISVQIDFGNRANSAPDPSTSIVKTDDIPSDNQMMPRSTGGESDQAFKRLKTSRS